MSTERVQIDPEGDVLIILPVKQPTAVPEHPKPLESPIEKHFICSKKHLTLASPRARKIFSSSFKEATKEDDSFHHWKFDATFDDKAFDLVLKVIHGKTRDIPRYIDRDLLTAVASVTDDLQCHDALNYHGYGWVSSSSGLFGLSVPQEMSKTLVQLVLTSFVFEHEGIFENSTKAAIRFNNGSVPTFELPIRADITSKIFSRSQRLELIEEGRIEERRLAILTNLVDGLKDLEKQLLNGQLGCSHGCTAMLLGALMLGMNVAGLYPSRESSLFSSLTLDLVIKTLRSIQSPTYFSAEKAGVTGKYSGSWALSARSNIIPTTNSKSPGYVGFGGFRLETASPPVTRSPFGGQARTQASTPATGGLFGAATTNNTSSSPTVVEKEQDPASLVRHSCSLTDLVKPLLDAAEAEIRGLKLADFSRP
ncbi:hypothetical protein ACHAPA_004766 [Fusarium lateritium]